MDISRVDLNLLVYLDVLLRERNVTKAANHLGITQPVRQAANRRPGQEGRWRARETVS